MKALLIVRNLAAFLVGLTISVALWFLVPPLFWAKKLADYIYQNLPLDIDGRWGE